MDFLNRLKVGVDALFAPATDPRHEFASIYERQLVLLEQVRQAIAALRTARRFVDETTAAVKRKLPQLEQRARHSFEGGAEDVARRALQHLTAAEAELGSLAAQLAAIQKEEQRLTEVEQRISAQLQTLYRQHEALVARVSAAQTHLQVKEQMLALSDELLTLSGTLEDGERQARRMQARATAIDELIQHSIVGNVFAPTNLPIDPTTFSQASTRLDTLRAEQEAKEAARGISARDAPAGRDGCRVCTAPAPVYTGRVFKGARVHYRPERRGPRVAPSEVPDFRQVALVSCEACDQLWLLDGPIAAHREPANTVDWASEIFSFCGVRWPFDHERWKRAHDLDDGRAVGIWFEAAVIHAIDSEAPATRSRLPYRFRPNGERPDDWPMVVADDLAPTVARELGVPKTAGAGERLDATTLLLIGLFGEAEALRVLAPWDRAGPCAPETTLAAPASTEPGAAAPPLPSPSYAPPGEPLPRSRDCSGCVAPIPIYIGPQLTGAQIRYQPPFHGISWETRPAHRTLGLVSCTGCGRLWVQDRRWDLSKIRYSGHGNDIWGEEEYFCGLLWPFDLEHWRRVHDLDDDLTMGIWFEGAAIALLNRLDVERHPHMDGARRFVEAVRFHVARGDWPVLVANHLAPTLARRLGVTVIRPWRERVAAARTYLTELLGEAEAERVLNPWGAV